MFAIILIVLDLITLFLLFFLAYTFKVAFKIGIQFSFDFYITHLYWLPFFIIILLFFQGIYTHRFSFFEESYRIFRILTISLMSILVFALIYNVYAISRYMLLVFWFFGSIFLIAQKYLFKRYIFKKGWFLKKVYILNNSSNYDLAKKIINENIYLGYEIVEDEKEASEVIVLNPRIDLNELSKLFKKYKSLKFAFAEDGIPLLNVQVENIFTRPLSFISVRNNLVSKTMEINKRIFDIVFATFLLILFFPVMVIIAFLVKLTSKGPIFYIQERPGKHGKVIKIYKFRTMYMDAEGKLKEVLEKDQSLKLEFQKYKKLKDDPRITKVGKFLRKFSLDELPQLFNVIKGDMSIVGPRPYQLDELKEMGEYKDIIFSVKPGLTGLWQISGRSDLNFETKLKLETWYVLNWNFWLDIFIIIRTIPIVISGKGAY
ncbi:MAG: exopolysaccharide biosynthesis polyprenyl glycosylphosphotransferase [candidate division WOR-3 bacterium]|nr:exopolysaccharide biosynthesis polyprenyl glycosylphosphotransferase [candidate division WOR-3 bacterium]MCX7948143.1 exopolysaccharide biosynthesis polyprenyl glycosylphosphotransferase [candidate division WOR-3 bacterium]MDW8151048.1 exopolysaccharide biosynthesis polyprenyl glycosylphosphotransferase [candidate division WOR-3 bacterium]